MHATDFIPEITNASTTLELVGATKRLGAANSLILPAGGHIIATLGYRPYANQPTTWETLIFDYTSTDRDYTAPITLTHSSKQAGETFTDAAQAGTWALAAIAQHA